MGNNLQVFDFGSEHVRTLTDRNGEPWFVAKDVCDILGIGTNHISESLDTDEMNTLRITEGTSGNPNKTIVSEPGLYKLIMRSRKPEAKNFQRWVTHEVLPTIRKHGAYATGQTLERILADPDFGIKLLSALKDEREKRQEAEKTIKQQEGKVLFAKAVESSNTSILVGELAKIINQNGVNIGANRLFAWLREHGWLMNRPGSSWNMPTQRASERGLFEIKETTVTHSDGHTTVTKTPKVTGKGQTYFVNLFLSGKAGA